MGDPRFPHRTQGREDWCAVGAGAGRGRRRVGSDRLRECERVRKDLVGGDRAIEEPDRERFVTFDEPDSVHGLDGTTVASMNEDGIIVGTWKNNAGKHGYARSPNGTFVALDAPLGAHGTLMSSIGPNGKMVAQYIDVSGNRHLVRLNAALTGF